MNSFVSQLFGNTFRLVLTSWHGKGSAPQKGPLNFSFANYLKTNSVTYCFYCFVGKAPFENMTKSCPLDLALFQKRIFFITYRKILLDNFLPKFSI